MSGPVPWYHMQNPNACPCRYCEERTPTCHGVCPKYKEWQEIRPKVEHVIVDIDESNRQRRRSK